MIWVDTLHQRFSYEVVHFKSLWLCLCPKAKQTTNYQSAASSFSNQGAAKHAQPKQASVASVTYTPQSHASGGSYHAAASYGGNKKYNNPLPQAQQQHYNSGGGGGSSSGGGGGGGAGGKSTVIDKAVIVQLCP